MTNSAIERHWPTEWFQHSFSKYNLWICILLGMSHLCRKVSVSARGTQKSIACGDAFLVPLALYWLRGRTPPRPPGSASSLRISFTSTYKAYNYSIHHIWSPLSFWLKCRKSDILEFTVRAFFSWWRTCPCSESRSFPWGSAACRQSRQ